MTSRPLAILVVDDNRTRGAVIEKAKGIMMRKRGLSEEEEACHLLRQTAVNEKRKLVEIARSVVTAASLLSE